LNQNHSGLPKGMTTLEAMEARERPAVVNLSNGNYIGAIYKMLDLLPVIVRVEKCQVLEGAGMMPEVQLTMRILGERGDENASEIPD